MSIETYTSRPGSAITKCNPAGVRTVSNRPALLFLLLAALSCAAYVPMAIYFGGLMWWSWGPFFAAGLLAPLGYYPVYLQLGGDTHFGSYARAWLALGKWPAGPAWFLWVLLVFDCVAALFFTALPHVFEALALALGRQPERKCLRSLSSALLLCNLDTVRGSSLDCAGSCKVCSGAGCRHWAELGARGAVEAEQDNCSCGLNRELVVTF